MTEKDFRELVDNMRDAQRMYFKTRHSSYLLSAKNFEKRVDEELTRWRKEEIDKITPKLF